VQRRHIEAYKTTLTTPRAPDGRSLKNNTVRMRLGMLRLFFERIIEWGWDDSPARCPVFQSDLPRVDDPVPKFLDDASAARFMRAAAELDPLRRLIVEMLARTGMRVGELCALRADAVMIIGDAHWLRIPVGKLHNDRLIPLHPGLVDQLAAWRAEVGPDDSGLLLTNHGRPLNRYSVNRVVKRVGQRAGIDGMHAHRLRLTLATQAINRGMSLEAIAALLGHRSMRMTLVYARIADRTVADEYYAVTEQVEALYDTTPVLPASAEGRQMRQLRVETYRRLLGNGYCTPTPRARLCFREHLRDLHPLPDRPRVPAGAAPPTRPRRRPPPGPTRRAVRQAPRRHRQGVTPDHQRLPCTTRNNPTDHRHIGGSRAPDRRG
jgi:integrase